MAATSARFTGTLTVTIAALITPSVRSCLKNLESRHSIKPQISRLGLICVIFFTVSGGAYGLEPLVGSLGAGWAVAFIALAPLVWCLPVTAMVSELSSMMPEEGGYYA